MRRLYIPLIIFILIALLCSACKQTPPVPAASDKQAAGEEGSDPDAAENVVGNDIAENPQDDTDASGEADLLEEEADFAQLGFDLMTAEEIGGIKLDMSEQDVVKAIGQPDSKSEAEIWEVDDMEHVTFTYDKLGMSLDMARSKNDKPYQVMCISIAAPCTFKTVHGIGIGSTEAQAISAYAGDVNPEHSEAGSTVVAGTVYGGVICYINEGKVESLHVGAVAE